MAKDDGKLSAAKRSYRSARGEGNREEEARWANLIGDMLKNRGEYVEALKWLRIDYEISVKCLPEKQLLPACQSLGDVHLRLRHFKDALLYQKKHLELAKDAGDLIEQQRASTQLGRTYHEMFLSSDDDHYSVRNAKKYFKSAMKLSQKLVDNPPNHKSSFLKEHIDAHNNIGMLEMDLDNLEEAEKMLTKALEICDEEEVDEDDDCRSRLHHNLGSVYMELRMWDKARHHVEKDVIICKRIRQCQGEAKGYINLGELHYRVQKYEDAILCYQKALDLAKSMEDEDALIEQIDGNITTVKEALKVMAELKEEEQNFKKLTRLLAAARGTPRERMTLLQQNAVLDRLIEKSSMIFAWHRHCGFAKRKKKIADELCDKEKLSDSFLVLGESYQKLRDFNKAIKWFTKSWEGYKIIGNLEGQALAKINIGDVLDCSGDWIEALNAFKEGYRISIKANLPSIQLSALENMHYSHMIRFDNIDEARRLQLEIDSLNQSGRRELEMQNMSMDHCSETETEENDNFSAGLSPAHDLPTMVKSDSERRKSITGVDLIISPMKRRDDREDSKFPKPVETSPKCLSDTNNQQICVARKHVQLVLSDGEDDPSNGRVSRTSTDDTSLHARSKRKRIEDNPALRCQEVSQVSSKCAMSSCNPVRVEESTCSYKSSSSKRTTFTGKVFNSSSPNQLVAPDISSGISYNAAHLKLHTSDNGNKHFIMFKIDDNLVRVEAESCITAMSIESTKAELACLYYTQLPPEQRSKGLVPIIKHFRCAERSLESVETFEFLKGDDLGDILIEAVVDGWIQKRLMKLYIDCCFDLSEPPNMKLLKKLYISEVEDEVVASDCELQDVSVTPLLISLHSHVTVAMVDLSHNFLGNGTMEKLQHFFTSSQKHGYVTLDLHCNRFGPSALFQICECPTLFTRLEVLNVSGNHLTDACGSYLSTIVENCKALYSLNIERCSITSRTIQKVADALKGTSALAQLFIGRNRSVSGNTITNLLAKLSNLESFAELSLTEIKLNETVIDRLCDAAKTISFSSLMLGHTAMGTDGAVRVTESLLGRCGEHVKLILSYCRLTPLFVHSLHGNAALIDGLSELSLEGNALLEEGANALVSLLKNTRCHLKILNLNRCQLGLAGAVQLIRASSENDSLEELYLAGNTLPHESSSLNQQDACVLDTIPPVLLEVADSEDDEQVRAGPDSSCRTSSSSLKASTSRDFNVVPELSVAISIAKQLQLLDLSSNSLSPRVAAELFAAWSSRSEPGLACQHVEGQTVHFSLPSRKCCRGNSCCLKD